MSSPQLGGLQQLEALTSEQDSAKRRELLRKVTDLFFVTEKQQASADKDVFGNVMARLSFELENEARSELAQRLSTAGFAPHNIVRRLAEDDIDVARPVLEKSTVLTDEDLVDIAYSKGQDHLMAMTRREEISSVVTDVIVQRGNDGVLTSVAGNKGAKFSSKGFDTLAMKATSVSELRSRLIERDDVPNEVVEAIKRSVSEKLKAEFDEQYSGISSMEIDRVVEAKSEHVDFSPLDATGDAAKIGKPDLDVVALYEKGVLNEAYVRDFVDQERRAELVHSLALLTKIDVNMAYHTLYEAEVPALAVLCKAFHFRRETFGALLQERVRNGNLSTEHVTNAMKRYEALTDETAQRILRFLKVRLSVAND